MNAPVFEVELAEFARRAEASSTKQIVLVLDRAGQTEHASIHLWVPDHDLLLFPLPCSPELQSAGHQYVLPRTNTALVNRHFATMAELEDAQFARCAAL